MRGKTLLCGLLATGLGILAGCHHERYRVKIKHPEDYVVPPNETRFDEPPEEDYRKPPSKKKDAPGLQSGGGPTPNSNMMGGPSR